METFLKNYWSLYMDFLHDFQSLHYQNISLVYLCHLPSYLLNNASVMQALKKESFIKNIKRSVTSSKEIQEKFSQFTSINQASKKKKKGKVAIHVDKLLRFPKKPIHQQLQSFDTILLTHGSSPKKKASKSAKKGRAEPINATVALKKTTTKPTMVHHTPLYYLDHFQVNVDDEIKQVQQQARQLLLQYEKHHLYQKASFQKWLLQHIAKVISHIASTIQLLQRVTISCFIVSTTHSFVSRILAVIGSKQGIPTICMQHGIISSELGYIPKIATVDAVYGQFEKDWYQQLGVAPSSIEIVGHPRFDQMHLSPKIKQSNFYNKLGLKSNRKTIMLAARSNEDIVQWRQFIQQLNQKQQYNIVIKNYPSTQAHPLTNEFENVYAIQGYSLYDIFPHVNAVVAYSSTVGLEAMLSKRIVFILNKNFPGITGYYESLKPLMQHDPRLLVEKVFQYFTQPSFQQMAENKRQQFLRYAYPSDQLSIDRLNKLVSRLTS